MSSELSSNHCLFVEMISLQCSLQEFRDDSKSTTLLIEILRLTFPYLASLMLGMDLVHVSKGRFSWGPVQLGTRSVEAAAGGNRQQVSQSQSSFTEHQLEWCQQKGTAFCYTCN
jgi:predicted NodU family carbamoyl transferase